MLDRKITMSTGLNKADFENFVENVKRLEQMAEPSNNDIRFGHTVQYINCAISKFVDEKACLVGSTAEHTKLSFSKDDGDADVLIISGRVQVPVANLEYKTHNSCYVWIHVDGHCTNMELELIDGRYLSSSSLRELRPELFTMLRAISLPITASFNRLLDTGRLNTVVTAPSKVGLACTTYEGLNLYGSHVQHDRHYPRKEDVLHRSEKTEEALIKRWKNVHVCENDKKMLKRTFKILKIGNHPSGGEENNGVFPFIVQAFDDAISRPRLTFSRNIPELDSKEKTSDNTYEETDANVTYNTDLNDEKNTTGNMKITYKYKHHMDFVPALKIAGEIGYMKKWRHRVEAAGWADSRINDISSTDVFVVARKAPVNPNIDKDFCLSFNLAEQKLVKSMNNVQRDVLLLLKCFLKGLFKDKHKKEGLEVKLKTYHVKTLLFWLYESYNSSSEDDDFATVYVLLQDALGFLRSKLIARELLHYFVPHNLFIDFEEKDFRILIDCVDTVSCNTTESITRYFKIDNNRPQESSVTPEEMRTILDTMDDGGRRQLVDKIEDAIIDVYRGLSESKKDAKGRASIKEAILDTCKLILNDEKHFDSQIFKQINNFLTGRVADKNDLNLVDADKRIKNLILFIEGLGLFVPKIKDFMKMFGGRQCLQEILQGAFTGKPVDLDQDLGEQILETIERYMSCADEEEDIIAAELKYKLFGYFSCREKNPHLSALRL